MKNSTYARISCGLVTYTVSGALDARLATGKIGCKWWWCEDEWYNKAKCPVLAVAGAFMLDCAFGADRAATSWWCVESDIGSVDSSILTCCFCVFVDFDGEEWWLNVSGEISILSGDDGDGGCFDDCVSINELKFKKIIKN